VRLLELPQCLRPMRIRRGVLLAVRLCGGERMLLSGGLSAALLAVLLDGRRNLDVEHSLVGPSAGLLCDVQLSPQVSVKPILSPLN